MLWTAAFGLSFTRRTEDLVGNMQLTYRVVECRQETARTRRRATEPCKRCSRFISARQQCIIRRRVSAPHPFPRAGAVLVSARCALHGLCVIGSTVRDSRSPGLAAQYKETFVWQPKHGSICFPLRWVQLKRAADELLWRKRPRLRRHTPIVSYSSRAQRHPAAKNCRGRKRASCITSLQNLAGGAQCCRNHNNAVVRCPAMTVPARAIAEPWRNKCGPRERPRALLKDIIDGLARRNDYTRATYRHMSQRSSTRSLP